ncbi:MAG: hypothetical protein KC519_09375, partial [Anaerolineae bacterium]|nr:hypothetical protein [Anaerolineae bacterium]
MADYQRTAPSEWTWHSGGRNHTVRLFASTRRLIWSAWVESDAGPRFDDGIAQSYDAFLANGAPQIENAPAALVDHLRQVILQADASGRRR